jgi:hypothetical protein
MDCGGAHPSLDTRFTTVDAAKPGDLRYAIADETPMFDTHDISEEKNNKAIALTDLFPEEIILQALVEDRVIKAAIKESENPTPPQKLSDLPKLFEKDFYGLPNVDFELRPDFLTRFAFHHVEGDKVAVRLGLPPHSGANQSQHMQIGLLLPIPDALREPLKLASTRKRGFLMKDAAKVSRGSSTKFERTNRKKTASD